MRLLTCFLFLFGWAPDPAYPQGAVDHVVMEVSLPERPGTVPVRLILAFQEGTAAGAKVPLTLLTPPPLRLAIVGASSGEGDPLPLPVFSEVRHHYWVGEITFAPSVSLEYSVEAGWAEDGPVTLPIPAPEWVPASPHPRTFVARVAVPAGWTVLESFPTSVTLRPGDGEEGVFEVALQGVPSMLKLRMGRGPRPVITLQGGLDLAVVSLLLLLGVLGVRYLRKSGG